MLDVKYTINENNEQILQLPKSDNTKIEAAKLRDYLFQSLKYKGKFLEVIGVKINDVGTNNPLSNPNDCITPIYKFLYYLSNMMFSLVDISDYEYFKNETLKIELEFDKGYISVEDLKDKLKEELVVMDYKLDNSMLLQTLRDSVKLTLLLDFVGNDYDIEELKFKYNLEDYYLPLCNKNITYRTEFNKEDYIFKFSPFICNFNEIIDESCSEYKEIEKF